MHFNCHCEYGIFFTPLSSLLILFTNKQYSESYDIFLLEVIWLELQDVTTYKVQPRIEHSSEELFISHKVLLFHLICCNFSPNKILV